MKTLQAAQQDMPDTGYFRANVTSQRNSRPISGATVQISDINNQDDILEEITTDQNGQSETVPLGAPPLEYSMIPESRQPYSVYNIRISAPGYEPVDVSGAEILSGEVAIQNVSLLPLDETEPDSEELFVIPPHTLYEEYPPKIPEEEIKDITQTGEIVLSRVVIPSGVRSASFPVRSEQTSDGTALPAHSAAFLLQNFPCFPVNRRRIHFFQKEPVCNFL